MGHELKDHKGHTTPEAKGQVACEESGGKFMSKRAENVSHALGVSLHAI